MILAIGEILFDLFPDYRTPGGAPFNFAFHISRLGLEVKVITRVGRDKSGAEMIEYVKGHDMDVSGIQTDESRETGKVRISLDDQGVPEFYIHPDMAYDNIHFEHPAHQMEKIDLLYFGTLIQRTRQGHQRLDAFLTDMKGKARLFCDLNLRPGCYHPQSVISSLNHADILKLNDFELSEIGSILGSRQGGDQLAFDLQEQYQIDVIALTRGEKGSVLYMDGRAHPLSDAGSVKVEPLVDTVGAGDAYAAMLAYGILNRWTPSRILDRATRLASHICTVKGAIPENVLIYRQLRQ